MGAELDRLEVQVEAQATKANNQLDKLVGKLDRVSSALSNLNSGGLLGLSNGVTKFAQASAQLSNVKTADFTRLTKNIQSLTNLNTQQIYGAASSMKTLSSAINSLGSVSTGSMQVAQVAKDISKLGNKSVQTAIANLPQLAVALKDFMTVVSSAPTVSRNIIQMTDALASLAAQGARVGTASNSLTNNVNRVGNAMSANTKKAKSFASVIGSLYQKFFWVSRGIDKLWDSVESSMSYVENLNYFDAAFGQVANAAVSQWEEAGYDSAGAYYNSFSNRAKELTSKMTGFSINDDGTLSATGEASLGINPSKLMNYQAMFAQMSSSMGVTSETSLKLSQALTEIGADLASVKNMDFEKTWKDMASGLAGMSRTLDKYGVNIRNVNLQQKLFDLGINENITNLNQNDKALLRAIILLDSTRYAWGDLADTLNQPANQMRLLESNISNLSRTVGNLFLPMISKVLPYVNGLVIALQRLATWFGNLMGIDLSEITSSIGDSEVDIGELLGETDDLTGSLNDAAKAADKLKKGIRGFDELNVITTQDDSGNANAGGAGLSSGLLDAAFEDAFSEYQKVWDEAFANMENRAQEFADKIERFFQPIKNIINDFAVGDFFKAGQDTSKLVSGIFDFFSDAIDDVDWDKIGENIGDYLAGIEWLEVIKSGFSLTQSVSDALAELWFGSLEKAPFETIIGTFLVGLSIVAKPRVALAPIFTWQAGFSIGKELGKLIDPNATEFYDNFKWLGEGGFFDTIKNTEFKTLLKAADELATDISNNKLVQFLRGDIAGLFGREYKSWSDITQEFEQFKAKISAKWDGMQIWWNESIVPWTSKEKWQQLGENAKYALSDKWSEFTTWWKTTGRPEWWDDVTPWFTKDKWKEFGGNIKSGLSTRWNEFATWWKTSGLYKWWTEDVEPFFSQDKWSWSGIKDGLSEAWDSAIESIKSLWNRFAEWLNDKLTINIDTSSIIGKGISEILGSTEISLGVIPTFKTGGFPEDGLFMANHNELVGQFSNGKTAVANNEQIISGIEQGVRDANAEQVALLYEQNRLLRAILEKELKVSNETIGRGARAYAIDYFNRTGEQAYT